MNIDKRVTGGRTGRTVTKQSKVKQSKQRENKERGYTTYILLLIFFGRESQPHGGSAG